MTPSAASPTASSRSAAVWAAVLLSLAVAVAVFGMLSAPHYLSYDHAVRVTEREDGLRCMYANLESIPTVNVGDQVSVGDTIGSVGDSAGCESAQESHLHLSVAASGQSVSPLDYLPQKN